MNCPYFLHQPIEFGLPSGIRPRILFTTQVYIRYNVHPIINLHLLPLPQTPQR